MTLRANCVTWARSTSSALGCQRTWGSDLGSDDAAIFSPDHDRRRARPADRLVVGPIREPVRLVRIGAVARRLARVLDVDESRAIVRRGMERGDLAAARPGEEAPENAGRRIDGERLVVAERCEIPLAQRGRRDV